MKEWGRHMVRAASNLIALYQTSHFRNITHLMPKIHIKNIPQMLSVRGGVEVGGKAVERSQFVKGSQDHQEWRRNSQQPEDRGQCVTGNKGRAWRSTSRKGYRKPGSSSGHHLHYRGFHILQRAFRTLLSSDLIVGRQVLLTTYCSQGNRDPEGDLTWVVALA